MRATVGLRMICKLMDIRNEQRKTNARAYLFLFSRLTEASGIVPRSSRPLAKDQKTAEIYSVDLFSRLAHAVGRRDVSTRSLREIVMHKVDDDGVQRDSDRVTQGERASERMSERASKTSTSLFPRRVDHYFPFPRDTSLMRRDDCSL